MSKINLYVNELKSHKKIEMPAVMNTCKEMEAVMNGAVTSAVALTNCFWFSSFPQKGFSPSLPVLFSLQNATFQNSNLIGNYFAGTLLFFFSLQFMTLNCSRPLICALM